MTFTHLHVHSHYSLLDGLSKVEEIVDEQHPDLDLEIDPKLSWALRHPEFFPVDVNTADYETLLRVPGLGLKSAVTIVNSRRFGRLTSFDLKRIGVVMKKAKYFITCHELTSPLPGSIRSVNELQPERVRQLLVSPQERKLAEQERQLTLDLEP
jgi:predicted DNA-binding helix-hairpin-helix protein